MEILKKKRSDTYSIHFKVERDQKLVGWAFLIIIKNDRHEEPYGIMENVYVEKEYRGQGIGSALVKQVIQEAKDLNCYKLLSQSRYGKEDVHGMYLRYGFKDHGKNFRMDLIDSEIKQRD